jgi:hypothetical protein
MGAGSSLPKRMPSLAAYKGKVLPTQLVVNNIFQFMMSEVEIQDLLKLANPRYCRDYVFVTKEALSKIFDEIQIEPKLGSKDVLYFQSVKKLTFADEKDASSQKLYRDMLCKQLAFFYVRIFQVFGALALTVIDSLPEAPAAPQDVRKFLDADKIRRAPLLPQMGGAAKAVTQDDATVLGNFFLYGKDFLYHLDTPGTFAISGAKLAGKVLRPSLDTGVIFFMPQQRPNVLYRPNTKTVIEADISIDKATTDSFELILTNISVNDVTVNPTYSFAFTKKTKQFTYEGRNLYSVIAAVLNQSAKREGDIQFGRDVQKPGQPVAPRGPTENVGVPTGLSYSYIIKYLQEKPKAYCVARAIQLLSPTLVESVRKETQFTSDICFYQQDSRQATLVPGYDQSVTQSSAGIRSLQQLFYDFLEGNTPKISSETQPKYREFVKMMQTIFSPEVPKEYASDLRDVKSVGFAQCKDPQYKDKELVIQNQNAIRAIQKHVAELLDFQMKHTGEVMKFLQRMFRLDATGKIVELQPALVKGGLPAVNKVADEARQILINYYKFCEGTYRLGALEVLAAPGKVAQARSRYV